MDDAFTKLGRQTRGRHWHLESIIQLDVWSLEVILLLFNISIIKHHLTRAALKMSE